VSKLLQLNLAWRAGYSKHKDILGVEVLTSTTGTQHREISGYKLAQKNDIPSHACHNHYLPSNVCKSRPCSGAGTSSGSRSWDRQGGRYAIMATWEAAIKGTGMLGQ
jgi:hypothetical protein